MSHPLLIYHPEAPLYGEILRKKIPDLDLCMASRPEEAAEFIEKAEILLTWKIPDELLRKAYNLKWFASLGAGNEHLLRNPLIPPTIPFTKVTVYGEMMAEYVFAYLLSFIRETEKYREDQKKKRWDPQRPGRLRGRVLGLLGLGSVGREIAKRGKQFGMTVIGVKRHPGPVENVDQVFPPDGLKKMLPMVDYLVNALPLTPETDRLLGEKELRLLREGTVLFNVGRGRTIDERALIQVLRERKIRAVLDVFEEEPLPPASELWTLDNVTVTPHVSGINLPEEICEEFVANYGRWVRGEQLVGLVDREKGY
ncbi:MAG: D-2-hydroxyacid dehydrogenase [Desulfobacterota bacterium]|nr:D-2-hydroxyacid dehydrogenase [Thermodesulfobacteriota bacterium]